MLFTEPAAIAFITRAIRAGDGVSEFMVVPLPSWPLWFAPQAHTWPDASIARLCAPPAATDTIGTAMFTRAGAALSEIVPVRLAGMVVTPRPHRTVSPQYQAVCVAPPR